MKRSRLKSKPKTSTNDSALSRAWYFAVMERAKGRCEACGRKGWLEGHHIIRQQAVRSMCSELRLPAEETQRWLWDVRNGLALCKPCHEKERSVPRSKLPGRVYEFCLELDLLWKDGRQPALVRLERDYLNTD